MYLQVIMMHTYFFLPVSKSDFLWIKEMKGANIIKGCHWSTSSLVNLYSSISQIFFVCFYVYAWDDLRMAVDLENTELRKQFVNTALKNNLFTKKKTF